MKFFVIRTESPSGVPDFPMTMFANDISDVMKRIVVSSATTAAVIIRERPAADAKAFGRNPDQPDDVVLEHPEIPWDAE